MTFKKNIEKFFPLLFFIGGWFILFLRKPSGFLQPQFWAEDGAVWYVNAYTLGLKSFFLTQDGYFQTSARIAGFLAQYFPLFHVPQLFFILGLSFQILPAVFFISKRSARLIPPLPVRLFIAIVYLVLPNTQEIHGNVTNIQWFLALTAFLIVVTPKNKKQISKIVDHLLLLLSGLSGPFGIFLLPIALIYWRARPSKSAAQNLFIVAGCALIQIMSVLFHFEKREEFGAALSWKIPIIILGKQLIGGLLFGIHGMWNMAQVMSQNMMFALSIFFTIIFLFIIGNALMHANLEHKLFIYWGMAMLIAGVLLPPQYQSMKYSSFEIVARFSIFGAFGRYMLIPMLVIVTLLVWGLSRRRPIGINIFSQIMLFMMVFGIVFDFHHLPFDDFHFRENVMAFEQLSSGETFVMPINPHGWMMTLQKK